MRRSIHPMWDSDISKREWPEPNHSRLIVWMSLRWVIPGELLSSIARFRFTHRSHPKPETSCSPAENQRTVTVSKLGCLMRRGQSIKGSNVSESRSQNVGQNPVLLPQNHVAYTTVSDNAADTAVYRPIPKMN